MEFKGLHYSINNKGHGFLYYLVGIWITKNIVASIERFQMRKMIYSLQIWCTVGVVMFHLFRFLFIPATENKVKKSKLWPSIHYCRYKSHLCLATQGHMIELPSTVAIKTRLLTAYNYNIQNLKFFWKLFTYYLIPYKHC